MPKLTDKYSRYKARTREIEDVLKIALKAEHLTQAAAKKIRMDQSTLSRKIRNVDKFTLGELREFAEVAGLEIIIRGKRSYEGEQLERKEKT